MRPYIETKRKEKEKGIQELNYGIDVLGLCSCFSNCRRQCAGFQGLDGTSITESVVLKVLQATKVWGLLNHKPK